MVMNFVVRLLTMPYLMETPGDAGIKGGGETGDVKPGGDNNPDHKPGEGDRKADDKGNPGAGGKQPAEDPRIAGLMADLQKERKARQKFEADHKTTAADLEKERKRVRALSGLENSTPEEENEALIRARINKMYPGLADLSPEDIAAIREMKGRFTDLEGATNRTWVSHANKMLGQVTSGVQKALGGGKLSDRQKARVEHAYVEEARSNPDFLARHEAGDETLIAEFVAGWTEDFVEPVRRSAQQAELQRRPRVPGGKDRSVIGANDKPIDVKDDKAVEDMLVKSFRDKGGQFGRR